MTIRVLIADDQPVVRKGFSYFLRSDPEVELVGTASTGREAVERVATSRPDVVLMDVRMPDGTGLWASRRILDSPGSSCAIIMMTTFDLDSYLFGALDLGASGFLLKDCDPEDLLSAVHTVAGGGSAVSDALTGRLVTEFARRKNAAPSRQPSPVPPHGLTQREIDVVRLLADGCSNKDIAESLNLELSTVKAHVGHITAKLKVTSRVQVVVWAFASGLVTPGTRWRTATSS